MDVESAVDGTLGKIIVPVGETVKVGTVLAYVNGGDGEDITAIGSEQPSSEDSRRELGVAGSLDSAEVAGAERRRANFRPRWKSTVGIAASQETGEGTGSRSGSGTRERSRWTGYRKRHSWRIRGPSGESGFFRWCSPSTDRRAADSERSDYPDIFRRSRSKRRKLCCPSRESEAVDGPGRRSQVDHHGSAADRVRSNSQKQSGTECRMGGQRRFHVGPPWTLVWPWPLQKEWWRR